MNAPSLSFSLERPDPSALKEMWTDLEQRAGPTFFLSWSWIGPWIEQAGAPDFVLVGRADDEVVCLGLLRRGLQWRRPFIRSRTIFLHETGLHEEDVIYIEHNGFLTDRRLTGVAPQAFRFLQSDARIGAFDELQIGGAPEALLEEFHAAGCRTHVYSRQPTALVDLRAIRESGGDYLATLSANTRYQVRRALKIYEARGPLSLQPARNTQEALAFLDELGLLHEAAWRQRGPGGSWRYPFLVNLHRRIIETAFTEGGVDIVRVTCGDQPIGYVHCLVRGGWIGSYLSGFDYEPDNKIKPGLVSFYLYIEHKLRSGGEVLDFLAGDHRYKTSLGQPGQAMVWFRVQQRRPQLMIEDGLRRVKASVSTIRHRLRSRRKAVSGEDGATAA